MKLIDMGVSDLVITLYHKVDVVIGHLEFRNCSVYNKNLGRIHVSAALFEKKH